MPTHYILINLYIIIRKLASYLACIPCQLIFCCFSSDSCGGKSLAKLLSCSNRAPLSFLFSSTNSVCHLPLSSSNLSVVSLRRLLSCSNSSLCPVAYGKNRNISTCRSTLGSVEGHVLIVLKCREVFKWYSG